MSGYHTGGGGSELCCSFLAEDAGTELGLDLDKRRLHHLLRRLGRSCGKRSAEVGRRGILEDLRVVGELRHFRRTEARAGDGDGS